ncbi:uncharacterized protein LOC144133843 [Amblyomma americanum]
MAPGTETGLGLSNVDDMSETEFWDLYGLPYDILLERRSGVRTAKDFKVHCNYHYDDDYYYHYLPYTYNDEYHYYDHNYHYNDYYHYYNHYHYYNYNYYNHDYYNDYNHYHHHHYNYNYHYHDDHYHYYYDNYHYHHYYNHNYHHYYDNYHHHHYNDDNYYYYNYYYDHYNHNDHHYHHYDNYHHNYNYDNNHNHYNHNNHHNNHYNHNDHHYNYNNHNHNDYNDHNDYDHNNHYNHHDNYHNYNYYYDDYHIHNQYDHHDNYHNYDDDNHNHYDDHDYYNHNIDYNPAPLHGLCHSQAKDDDDCTNQTCEAAKWISGPGGIKLLICTVGPHALFPDMYVPDGVCHYLYYTDVFIVSGKVMATELQSSFQTFKNVLKTYSKTKGGLSFDIKYVDVATIQKNKGVITNLASGNIGNYGFLGLIAPIEILQDWVENKASGILKELKNFQGGDKSRRTIIAIGTFRYNEHGTWTKFTSLFEKTVAQG